MRRVVLCAALLVAACADDSPPSLQSGDAGKDATAVDGTTDAAHLFAISHLGSGGQFGGSSVAHNVGCRFGGARLRSF